MRKVPWGEGSMSYAHSARLAAGPSGPRSLRLAERMSIKKHCDVDRLANGWPTATDIGQAHRLTGRFPVAATRHAS